MFAGVVLVAAPGARLGLDEAAPEPEGGAAQVAGESGHDMASRVWTRVWTRRRVGVVERPRKITPARAIRVEDELWERAKKRAAEKGETVSEAVRKFLERYSR